MDKTLLRQLVNYLPQQPYVFNGTILENLLLGAREGTSQEDILRAVEIAGIREDIELSLIHIYAQNFLIKKNLAKEANAQAIGELRGKQKSEEKAHAELVAEAKDIQAKLAEETTVVQFTEKIGPDGRTFGSITNKKIAEELQKQFGIKIDKRHIQVALSLIHIYTSLLNTVQAGHQIRMSCVIRKSNLRPS